MLNSSRKGVSPVIAIVLLLMMTVAAAGAAYFWLTQMQSGIQERSTKSIENIMQSAGRRLVAQAAICEPTAPEGTVAWYEFEEGSGNKTYDSSENENTGTLYPKPEGRIITDSEMWVDGKAGKAMDFDGNDSYVLILDEESFNFQGTSFSVVFWEKRHGGGAGNPRGFRLPTSGHTQGVPFHPYWENGTDRQYWPNVATSSDWFYVALVYNYTSKENLAYRNREYLGSETTKGSIEINHHSGFLGCYSPTSHLMNGSLDEFRVYSRALTWEEINETYKGKMKVKVTVRNVGSVKIPKAKFVANLKKDGTTVDSDTYTTTSSIDTGDLKTLTFYFNEMRPGGEKYTISIPGIDVSQSVKCQSLE